MLIDVVFLDLRIQHFLYRSLNFDPLSLIFLFLINLVKCLGNCFLIDGIKRALHVLISDFFSDCFSFIFELKFTQCFDGFHLLEFCLNWKLEFCLIRVNKVFPQNLTFFKKIFFKMIDFALGTDKNNDQTIVSSAHVISKHG